MLTSSQNSLNIWFSRTFRSNYSLIQALKNNSDGRPVTIYATHPNVNFPVLQIADWAGEEPDLEGEERVDWMVGFCAEHSIDVLIPLHNMNVIAERVSEFEAVGTKVMISSADTIKRLADKNLTYESAAMNGVPVPPWRTASNVDDFVEAYHSLREETGEDRIVMKPTVGIGAKGFRIITDQVHTIETLFDDPAPEVSFDYVREVLSLDGGIFEEFMLMPFLEEPEISVDCLSDSKGNLLRSVQRSKLMEFTSQFVDEDAVNDSLNKLFKSQEIKYLTNTQFRWWRGELVLLETNTRISGGFPITLLTGVNMIWEAVKVLIGEKVILPSHEVGGFYTNVVNSILVPDDSVHKFVR